MTEEELDLLRKMCNDGENFNCDIMKRVLDFLYDLLNRDECKEIHEV